MLMLRNVNCIIKMLRLRYISIAVFILSKGIVALEKCTLDLKVDSKNPCSTTEYCEKETNTCQCRPGFTRINITCVKQSVTPHPDTNYSSLVENQGSGSLVAGILVPIFLIVFVIFSVYISRKYELLNWIRSKMNRRDQNYDEFMIGQDDDDPPLA